MFKGTKEDINDFIIFCEKQIEFLSNQINKSLESQRYCKTRIQQEIFKETFSEALRDEEDRCDELKKALINAEDFLNNLKSFSKQY